MAIAQLSIDITAQLATLQTQMDGLTRKLDADAAKIRRSFDSIDSSFGVLRAGIAGLASAFTAGQLASAFTTTLAGMADLKSASERTGVSVEKLGAMLDALKPTGVGLAEIVGISEKLTQSMQRANERTSLQADAFSKLGVAVRDGNGNLKSSIDVLNDLARTLADYGDGANKTAIAQALLGESGGKALAMMKDLAEVGEGVTRVTAEQARQADELQKTLGRLSQEGERFRQSIVNALVPGLLEMTSAFNNARTAGLGLFESLKVTPGPGANLQSLMAPLRDEIARLEKLKTTAQEGADRATYDGTRQRYQAQIDALAKRMEPLQARLDVLRQTAQQLANATIDPSNMDARDLRLASGVSLPQAPAIAASKAPAKATTGIQAAQLRADVAEIRAQFTALAGAYSDTERILDATRSAGLIGDQAYYEQKKAIIAASASDQQTALQAELDRLAQEKTSGKERIALDQEMAAARQKMADVARKAAIEMQALTIEQIGQNEKLTESLKKAAAVAEEYQAKMRTGYARQLAGYGQGEEGRRFLAGQNQIDDRYASQIADLQTQSDFAANDQLKAGLEARIATLRQYQQVELQIYADTFAEAKKKQADVGLGFADGVADWQFQAEAAGTAMRNTTVEALDGMADAFANLAVSGKLSFKSLADSIVADLARIAARQMVLKAITGIASLFGGGVDPSFAGVGASPYAKGGAFDRMGVTAFASGGIVDRPTMFAYGGITNRRLGVMGEAGPEAIMPLARGRDGKLGVRGGGGGGVTINQTLNVQSGVDVNQLRQAMVAAKDQAVYEVMAAQDRGLRR